jgi:uncharacterized membrane protein
MNSPARLHRKEENSSVNNKVSQFYRLVMDTIEAWVLSHAFLCLIVAICLLMALFVTFLFAITGVSAVESGTYYNNLNNII